MKETRNLVTTTVTATALAGALALAGCGGADGAGAAPEARRADGGGAPTASLRPVGGSGLQGWARITTGGDSLTLKLELLGVSEGTEYGAALLEGACEGGEPVADLESPHVGTVGVGSSLTRLPKSALGTDATHAVAVFVDGERLSCGEFGTSPAG